MIQLGQGKYWDELKVGDRFKSWGRTITDADIVNFVNATGMLEVLFTDAEFRARIPMGRFGTSEEVAQAELMVIGNAYMTGQTVQLNGGMSFI